MPAGRFFVRLTRLMVVKQKARTFRRREESNRLAPRQLVARFAQLTAMQRGALDCIVGSIAWLRSYGYIDVVKTFVEFNTGWIAWVEELMDYYDKVFREYDEIRKDTQTKPTVYPDLPHPPSYYVQRQCHATFQVDHIGMRNVPYSGAVSLMWGHDYPHEEGTYPNSRTLVDEQAAHVAPEQARKIFRENALDVFRFDRNLLAQPF